MGSEPGAIYQHSTFNKEGRGWEELDDRKLEEECLGFSLMLLLILHQPNIARVED